MIASLEHDGTILMDTDIFIPYFRGQLRSAGQSTMSLDRALAKAHLDATTTMKVIEDSNMEQVRLLHRYIEAEEAKTKSLEKLIERMQHPDILLSSESLDRAAFVSAQDDRV